ncbi:MAG TPA: asparagine synthase (glutamine-hydrolyzing) [Longimicrobiaceae bacterium]|nr:asparagine synthase (glutamine-hydrolyzing) [Longimicrobiaceae bacterium]
MCGLAGFLDSRPASAGEMQRRAGRMSAALAHRGPDDDGVFVEAEAGIALAFRRLAIVDLSPAGHQPMRSGSGRFVMAFNGEVYNHVELRRELERDGAQFRGHSDTEVMLAAFERWGVEASLKRFVGMFAIALWDVRLRRLHVARDRMGIKPLYVHHAGGCVAFASEPRAFAADPAFRPEADPASVAAYLRYLYVPAPGSIFRGVTRLPAGTVLTIDDAAAPLPEPRPFWSVEEAARHGIANPFSGDDDEAADEVERVIADAVRLRMRADVPLGAFLSGGIDSSLVVSLMQAWSARPVKTFTIGFDAAEHDESAHAAAVARHLGTEHTSVTLTGDDALASIPDLPRLFDEPLADPSLIPTLLVSRVARRDVTVALSGDGGDELFAGYNRYVSGERAIRRAVRIPSPVRRALAGGLSAPSPAAWDRMYAAVAPLLPASARARLPGDKAHKLAALLRQPGAAGMYRSLLSQWGEPERVARGAREPAGVVERVMGGGAMPLMERMQLADQLGYLPDDLLAKLDRASMSVGLEARVPLLDHRVAELAWSLPRALRVRGGEGKWILRRILHRHVPPALVDRPKTGFTVPLDAWLRGPLRQWASDLLSPATVRRSGLLDANAADAAWRDFQAGRGRGGLAIWAVLVLLQWHEQWVQAPAREPERRPVAVV